MHECFGIQQTLRPLKKILILFAHPRFEESRINHALIETASQIDGVTIRDLYERYPDFNVDIQLEQIELLQHDVVIFHHPFYWYSCPPLLKQWIDVVLEYNWAYGPHGGFLAGKKAITALTAGGPRKVYCESGQNNYTISQFLRPFEQTAKLCKMDYLPPFAVLGVNKLDNDLLKDYQNQYKKLIELLKSGEIDHELRDDCQFINDLDIINKVTFQ